MQGPTASSLRQTRDPSEDEAREREWRLRIYEARLGYHSHLLAAVVSFATTAIRGLFLLNGGAVIALLAFYGNALSATAPAPHLRADILASALGLFIGGLIGAFCCAAAAYLGQMTAAEQGVRDRRLARAVRVLALLCAAASLAFFAGGAFRALESLA